MKTVLRVAAGAVVLVSLLTISFAVRDAWAQKAAEAKKLPPPIARPVLFNTPEADRILSQMQVFPPNNPWHWDVSYYPVLKNSKEMIATIGAEGRLAWNWDMNFMIVPPTQVKVPVKIVGYPDESDKGPYPVPDGIPTEGWPVFYKGDLKASQEAPDGDGHAIIVDPWSGKLYEFFVMKKTPQGWQAEQASIFNLNGNELRPDGWTSADAAGLPIFPATIRFDECERGMVDHAMRVTIKRTRASWVYPATHKASRLTDENLPRMGERLRLRADFDVAGFSPHVQAILKGLKVHGMFVADNGGNWRISVAPDERIKGLDELRRVKGSDFEVVDAARFIPPAKKPAPPIR